MYSKEYHPLLLLFLAALPVASPFTHCLWSRPLASLRGVLGKAGQTVSRHARLGLVSVTLTCREKQKEAILPGPMRLGGQGCLQTLFPLHTEALALFKDKSWRENMLCLGTGRCEVSQPWPGRWHRRVILPGSDWWGRGLGRRRNRNKRPLSISTLLKKCGFGDQRSLVWNTASASYVALDKWLSQLQQMLIKPWLCGRLYSNCFTNVE